MQMVLRFALLAMLVCGLAGHGSAAEDDPLWAKAVAINASTKPWLPGKIRITETTLLSEYWRYEEIPETP